MTDSTPQPLPPGRRFVASLVAYLLLSCASPGIVSPGGSLWMAVLGIAVWGAIARRPGRRAFLVEWLTGAVGMGIIVGWILYVPGPGWPYAALGKGAYCALAGVVLRRLAPHFPLAVAVPLAWIGVETLRSVVPPPIGWGWLRLGHYAHLEPWLVGSARVFGVQGVGFALALVAGALAAFAVQRQAWRGALVALALGLGVPAALTALVPAPLEADGPRLLLVQPGIPQIVKQSSGTSEQLFERGVVTTRAGLDAHSTPPDLVCWGESMLPVSIAAPDLRAALRRGVESAPWIGGAWGEDFVDRLEAIEDAWVRGYLLGIDASGRSVGRSLLPRGTSFLAGADTYAVDGDRIVRRGAGFLWSPTGERQPAVGKVHVVPGAETIYFFQHVEWAREACVALMRYVPDLEPFDAPGAVELEARDGRRYSIGISVCYDNSFIDPYVDVVRSHGVDFHLVLSNEAWYESGYELDQMLAFSALAAITTGRSVVRATNSGVTAMFGPDGSERARLRVDGRDREVTGSLAVTVPVAPRAGDAATAGAAPARTTIFTRTRPMWLVLWIALPLVALARGRMRASFAFAGAGERDEARPSGR